MDHEREHGVDDVDVDAEFWSRIPEGRFARHRAERADRTDHAPARRPWSRSPRPSAAARTPRTDGGTRRPAQPGSRTHHDDTGPVAVHRPITESIPVVTEAVTTSVRQVTRHVDPLIRRLGVAAIVTALAVPVALSLRNDDPGDLASPDVAAAEGTTAGATALSVASEAPAAPADASANPWAGIDIDALPEAVPVNTEPAAPATESASSATPATEAASARSATSQATAPTAPATSQATAPTAPAARTQTVSQPACGSKYTVRPGDAWLLIADRADVTLRALLDVNRATTATALYPGRSICLPVGATTPRPSGGTTSSGSGSGGSSAPTTTKPKPTTTTAAPAPTVSYSRAQVERIIREVWPDHLEDRAVAIAIRESNLQPTARNYCCHGLFQIYFTVHRSWLANIGITSASQLYDPRKNAYAAYVLYLRSGSFAPWGG